MTEVEIPGMVCNILIISSLSDRRWQGDRNEDFGMKIAKIISMIFIRRDFKVV